MLRRLSSNITHGVVRHGCTYKPFQTRSLEPWNIANPCKVESSKFHNWSRNVMGVLSKKPFLSQSLKPCSLVLPNKGQTRNYEALDDWKNLVGYEYVNLLTDKTIDSFLKGNDSVMVMFYAPWCHHCKGAKPEFAKAAYVLQTEMKAAKLAAIDCIIYPPVYEKYEVTGYPTFKYYRNGTLIGEYHHRRRAMDLVHFMLRSPKTKGEM